MIANLLEIPRTPSEWERWSFAHRTSHTAIRHAIFQKYGVNLTEYSFLYPINLQKPLDFLQANSQSHIEMDSVLHVQNTDLQDVDLHDQRQLSAWIYLHWLEHNTAEIALGI